MMFRCSIFALVCLLIMTACQNNAIDSLPESDEETTVTESTCIELECTELELDIPFNPDYLLREDGGFILENGNIVIRKFGAKRGGNTYYYHYIYDTDGNRIHPGNAKEKFYRNYCRVILETDQNTVIVTDKSGKTMLFDSAWNELDMQGEVNFFHSYPLDDGMYFAVNDTYMLNYEYAPGEGWTAEPEMHYALYRYTEKITDTVFSKIIPHEDGFLCIYADSVMPGESIFIKADIQTKEEKNDFVVFYDSSEEKYYCVNHTGEKILDKPFDYISKPNNNTSIAFSDNSICLIHPADESNI